MSESNEDISERGSAEEKSSRLKKSNFFMKSKKKSHKKSSPKPQPKDSPPDLSESESSNSDESESDESNENIYEEDGFVVPDDEISEEPEPPFMPALMDQPKKPKKSAPKRLRKLEEEDLDLIKENLNEDEPEEPVKKQKLIEESEEISELASEQENEQMQDETDLQTLAEIFSHKPIVDLVKEREVEVEPADKKERFGTKEYMDIMQIDIPERLQHRLKHRLTIDTKELELEAKWLTERFMKINTRDYDDFDNILQKINRFLTFYLVEKNEITYIEIYKLYLLEPELKKEHLWELERWDYDWAFLWDNKKKCRDCIMQAEENTQTKQYKGPEHLKYGAKLIRQIEDEELVPRQVTELLNTRYSPDFYKDIHDLQKWISTFVYTHKEQSLNTFPSQSSNEKITKFLQNTGMNPVQLSENLKKRELFYKSDPSNEPPESIAFDCLGEVFKDESKVLSAATSTLKKDIASLPWVRQFVREEYKKYIKLFTCPTESGRSALDIYHPQYKTKNIEGKTFESISQEFWADIWKAEKCDWIQVEFRFDWPDFRSDKILPLLQPLYFNDEPTDIDSRWNSFKLTVLEQALTEIYKDLSVEFYNDLCNKTEDLIIQRCKERFRKIISAPNLFCEDEVEKSKIFVFVTDPNEEFFGRTIGVLMDSNGHSSEVNEYRTVTCRSFESLKSTDKEIYNKEREDLRRIILDHNPFAIVIAANCLHSMQVKRYLTEFLAPRTRENSIDWKGKIFMQGIEVPKIFSNSQRAKRLMPDSDNLTRIAISLGRTCLSPLAETLSLSSDPNENLTLLLSLDPMQKLPNSKRLEWQLENVACQVVCATQVDINKITLNPHLQAPLAYVAGLGPAKAYKLIETIFKKFKGKLKMRVSLIIKQCIGPKVYENAAGFIFIKRDDNQTDPLDSTRIHPSQYIHATRIAMSAFESKDGKEDEAISRILREPGLIETLDLQQYAETLEKQGHENMKSVFDFIKKELEAPSALEKRRKKCEFSEPEGNDLLYLISGESKETLDEKKLVNCSVIGYDDKNSCLVVKLESGVRAFIDRGKIQEGKNPTKEEMKMFIKGKSLTARVIQIEYNKNFDSFRIRLSILPSDLKKTEYLPKFEDTFKKIDEDWNEKAGLEDDEYRQGQKYVPRVVNHPRFKNITLKTACDILADKDIGECLFRPSSRGQDHLTCTWKFYSNVFAHLDILEEGKPAANMLGTRFRISDETYESLQEIIDRYIMPCEKMTKEVISNPKFLIRSETVIQLLKTEKRGNPNRIPYYFTINDQYPQFILLHYIPKEKTVVEYIKIKPKGLFFHEAYHTSLNYLIGWFKRHQAERAYQIQLQKTKPPVIDTTSHMSIKGRQEKPMTPLHPSTPGRDDIDDISLGDRTPDHYDKDDNRDRRGKRTPSRGRVERVEKRDEKICKKCGNAGHFAKDCIKMPEKCYKCDKTGHFAKECPEKMKDYN